MKLRQILVSTVALSLLALGGGSVATHASSVSYAHPYNALHSYMKLGHFHMVNNGNYSVPASYSPQNSHITNPARVLHTIGGNWATTYKPYAQFNDSHDDTNPQSCVIKPDGTTFIAYDVNGGSDTGTKVRISRYNINKTIGSGPNTTLRTLYNGPTFNGGHGQALAWNPKTNDLWLEYNLGHQGSRYDVRMQLIDQDTLKPIHTLKFKFSPYPFGAVLAFDNHGNAYNATDTFGSTKGGAPKNSLKLFKGYFNKKNAHFNMIKGFRHDPGAVMQNVSYNPANNRLYFLADGDYLSAPVNKLGKNLKPSDIRATKLSGHYEPEDLAFYHGHTLIMMHYPNQLLMSTRGINYGKKRHHVIHGLKKSFGKYGKKHSNRSHRSHSKYVDKKRFTKKHSHKAYRSHRSHKSHRAFRYSHRR